MGELSYTVGGDSNLVSFKSAVRVPITSLKAHFKPKQDLHGYSKPWPAGSGKNLITSTEYSGDFYTNQTGIDLKKIKTYASFVENDNNITVNTTADWYGCIFATKLLSVGDYEVHLTVDANFRGAVFVTDDDLIVTQVRQYSGSSINQTVTLSEPGKIAVYIGCGAARSTVASDLQVESGTSYTGWEPYENICPIEGWNGTKITRTGKNIARITGYSAENGSNANGPFVSTNSYGTTMSTKSFTLPDTSVTITQSQWPNSDNTKNYRNGYFGVFVENLEFGKYYDISFKITNITNNPFNLPLSSIVLMTPKGSEKYSNSIINGNTILFKNIQWEKYPYYGTPNRSNFEIRNCGMSFTLSEFMVTEANTNDGVFEPYCGEVIPITFPIIGKNLCNSASGNDLYFTGGIGYGNYTIENGSMTTSGGVLMGFKTPCIPNTTYTFSFTSTYTGNNLAVRVYENIDEPMVFPTQASGTLLVNEWHVSSATFTTGETTNWITVGMYIDPTQGANGITMSNFMLNFGSTAEIYKPYSADNTYYSGYVDLATGEVVAEYGIVTLTGNENVTWSVWSASTIYTGNTIFQRKPNNSENILIEGWCNYTRQNNGKLTNIAYPSVGSYGLEFNNVISYWGLKEATAQALKAKLQEFYNSGKPLQIVYKLNTPQVIPINPTELKTFLNVNNIWTNTNDITEVSYALHDTAPICAAKKRMAAENDKHYRKVLWNQMAGPMTSSYWELYNTKVSSVDYIDDYAEVTINKTATYGYEASIRTSNDIVVTTDHYYYASYLVCPNYSGAAFGMEFAGGATIGRYDAPINEWTMISTGKIKGFRNGGGKLYIPYFVNGTYQAGDKAKVKNIIYVDLTKMFGHGNEPTGSEFRRMCAMNNIDFMSYHPIDSGTEQIWCIPGHDTNDYTVVNWNQRGKEVNSSNYRAYNSNYIDITFEDNAIVSTWLSEGSEYLYSVCANYNRTHTLGNYFYLAYDYYTDIDGYIGGDIGGETTTYKRTKTNQWTRYSDIKQRTTSGNLTNAVVYVSRFNEIVKPKAGNYCKARNIIAIDLTQMFGAGNEPTTVAELRETCLKNNINLDEAQPYTTGSTMIWKK